MSNISAILIAIIGLFILFILTKKGKKQSDYVLLVFNLVLILTALFDYDSVIQDISSFKVFVHFNTIFWLSTTFLIYSYSLLERRKSIIIKWWFFAFSLPFFLYSFWDLLLNAQIGSDILHIRLRDPSLIYHLFFKGHKLFIIVIAFDILRRIKNYRQFLKLSFSYIENISLKWLRNYTLLTLITFSLHLIFFLLYNLKVIPRIDIAYTTTGVLMVFGAFYLSYFGIKQYSHDPELDIIGTKQTRKKPFDTVIQPKSPENIAIFEAIESLFREEQIYTDPNLRIRDVAEKAGVPVHKLSEAINDQFKKPFYDYVAFHRCELLKQKLIDPNNSSFTILGLAIESGFNSKSTLNRSFKEQTGLTPTQFKKAHFAK